MDLLLIQGYQTAIGLTRKGIDVGIAFIPKMLSAICGTMPMFVLHIYVTHGRVD